MQQGSTSVQRLRVIWVTRALIALLAFGFAVLLEWQRPAYLVRIDEGLRDSFLRNVAQTAPEERLVVVDIDDASLRELGAWPWPRGKMADLIELLLGEYGAKGVGLDMVFPEAGEPLGDARMAALAKHAPLALAQVFDYAERSLPTSQGELAGGKVLTQPESGVMAYGFVGNHAGFSNARCVGNIGYIPDVDGVLRHTPALTYFEGKAYWSLSSALLNCVEPSSVNPSGNAQGLWRVPYAHALSSYRVISVMDVLQQKVSYQEVQGRFVLVGSSAVGLGDRFSTSLATLNAGVMVHAANLSGLMDMREGRIQAPWSGRVALVLWCALTVAMAMFLIARLSAASSVLVLLLLVSTWLAVGLAGAAHQAEWSLSAPLWAYFVLLMTALPHEWWQSQRRAQRLSSTFSHYVSKEVLDEILRLGSTHGLEPKLRNITVLIADMEGYTLATSELALNAAAELTREFLETLTRPVLAWRGTLDRYNGDGMVAFWGAPLACEDHADLAVSAALDIFKAVKALNVHRQAQGLKPVRVRIGIESGSALVGDLGSSFRSTYTAVGDCINFASRLESAARDIGMHFLIGSATQAQLKLHAPRSLGRITLRGTQTMIEVFTLEVAQ